MHITLDGVKVWLSKAMHTAPDKTDFNPYTEDFKTIPPLLYKRKAKLASETVPTQASPSFLGPIPCPPSLFAPHRFDRKIRTERDVYEILEVAPSEIQSFYFALCRKPTLDRMIQALESFMTSPNMSEQTIISAVLKGQKVVEDLGRYCTVSDQENILVR